LKIIFNNKYDYEKQFDGILIKEDFITFIHLTLLKKDRHLNLYVGNLTRLDCNRNLLNKREASSWKNIVKLNKE
jgi:hypothetical protein